MPTCGRAIGTGKTTADCITEFREGNEVTEESVSEEAFAFTISGPTCGQGHFEATDEVQTESSSVEVGCKFEIANFIWD